MACLTITPTTVNEAIRGGADLIVVHHPLPFSAVKRLTADTIVGRMLLELISAGVAVYSPHTAFDSAAEGINQHLAEGLGLTEIVALVPHAEGQGSGRLGQIGGSLVLGELAQRLMKFLGTANLQMVGNMVKEIRTVAVACGGAGEFLEAARARAAMPWCSARPASILAWRPRPGESASCCRATSPASGLPSTSWLEHWAGNSPRFEFGPAEKNAIRCSGWRGDFPLPTIAPRIAVAQRS